MSATSYVQGDAGRIEARLILPPEPRAGQVAVICHPHPLFGGTMDNKVVTTLVRGFKDAGLAAVTFNFRGVGQSEGTHDRARGEIDDLLAVVRWAQAQTEARELYLAGFSFGSYVAAAAVERLTTLPIELKRLFLIAPPVHHYPFADLVLPAHTLVVQGDADEVVPADQVFAWAEGRQVPVVRMPGVSHFFHGHLSALKQHIVDNLV